jgi:hypothetical protein
MENMSSPLTFEAFMETKPYNVEETCRIVTKEAKACSKKQPPEGALEKLEHEMARSLYYHYLKEQADKILANHHFPSIDAIEKYKPILD